MNLFITKSKTNEHIQKEDKENTDDVAFMCEDDLELFKIEKEYLNDALLTSIAGISAAMKNTG